MRQIVLSGELWQRIAPHIPHRPISSLGGRPRLKARQVFAGIAFIKGHKLPWRAADREVYGSKTALNDYYRYWAKRGVFHALKAAKILRHPELVNINFDWPKIKELFGQKTTQFSDNRQI